ncbi:MAG: hypothetical protein ABIT37_00110 [Luteolibacter sp.]
MQNIQRDPAPASGSIIVTRSITRELVHARTLELALIDGRNSHQIKQVDYERAKRELTGESDFDRQQQILDFHQY